MKKVFLFLFASVVIITIAAPSANENFFYTEQPLPQAMHHHGFDSQWRWLPGYIDGQWYKHAPPSDICRMLYHNKYLSWGEGLRKVPTLTDIDLDQLARTNQWDLIRENLAKALAESRRSQGNLSRKSYLRLLAHCDGVGLFNLSFKAR